MKKEIEHKAEDMEAGAMEGEETKKGKRKGRDTGFDDIDDKFDQLLAFRPR